MLALNKQNANTRKKVISMLRILGYMPVIALILYVVAKYPKAVGKAISVILLLETFKQIILQTGLSQQNIIFVILKSLEFIL